MRMELERTNPEGKVKAAVACRCWLRSVKTSGERQGGLERRAAGGGGRRLPRQPRQRSTIGCSPSGGGSAGAASWVAHAGVIKAAQANNARCRSRDHLHGRGTM